VVNSTRSTANQYAGYYVGNTHALRGQASSYGLVGAATGSGGVGVRGDASVPNGWGGYFTGTYGVVGISSGSGTWGVESYGYGSDSGGVYIGNDHGDAKLCLNGTSSAYCTTRLPTAGYYTMVNGYYYGNMSGTNTSGRGMMVMAWYGNNPYCGGNNANHTDLQGYMNGSVVAYSTNASDDRSKYSSITFYVPNGASYAVYSQPYACSWGYFYVSTALI
jgi:hypothetical protein